MLIQTVDTINVISSYERTETMIAFFEVDISFFDWLKKIKWMCLIIYAYIYN